LNELVDFISKKDKYLIYKFDIELFIKNVQFIYNIKKILGVITFRKSKNRSKTVFLRIKNKYHFFLIYLTYF
jgi:hypothetical protein